MAATKNRLNLHPEVFKLGLVSFLTDLSSEMIFSVFAIFGRSVVSGRHRGVRRTSARSADSIDDRFKAGTLVDGPVSLTVTERSPASLALLG